jgi:hypothetical protein
LRFLLVGLLLFAAPPAGAQTLDLDGSYGNADGCKYARDGQMSSDDVFLLKSEGFESYGTSCEFVEVLAARDGSKVVTGLCQFEGEDGFGALSFVVRKSASDPAALTVYKSDGSVFGEVRPCF